MFWYNLDMSDQPPSGRGLAHIWRRLLNALGLTTLDRRVYTFEGELIQSLEDLAEREQRPEQEVAAELLALAKPRQKLAAANALPHAALRAK